MHNPQTRPHRTYSSSARSLDVLDVFTRWLDGCMKRLLLLTRHLADVSPLLDCSHTYKEDWQFDCRPPNYQ